MCHHRLRSRASREGVMRTWPWLKNVYLAVKTVGQGMYVTLWYFFQTYKRRRHFTDIVRPELGRGGAYTQFYEYPELPVPVKPRYRGFHRFDLTTCIGCDKCARACPVDCIYIDKEKNPVGKGLRVNGFKIDYTKCMFCALCVDPCPVDCIFMGSTYDQSCYSRDGCIVDYAKLPVEVAWGQERMQEYEQELKQIGVELKDYFGGLIDFPGLRNGRPVYLCWRLGEPEVSHWHDLEAGFAGRQKWTDESPRHRDADKKRRE